MKRILIAGTGGGMRGFSQCAVLAEIERRVGKPTHAFCDLYGGTSVASITGLSLAAGNSAEQTLGFFTQDGPEIFKSDVFTDLGLLEGPRFGSGVIEQKLQSRVGLGMMSDAKMNILVPATDLATREAFFIKSYDPDTMHSFKMWEAARASSAAQSYFPGFACNGHYFWDGGNAANNPAMCVLSDAVKKWGWDGNDFILLSIGCGAPTPNPNAADLMDCGIVKVGIETLTLQMMATAAVVDYQAAAMLDKDFYQIQPVVTTTLADASPAALVTDQKEAADCIAANDAAITAFCQHVQDRLAQTV